MTSNTRIFFTFSLILFSIHLALATKHNDGYVPINDRNDPTVNSIAEFAVNEHNKQHMDTLSFIRVLNAEKQFVPEGTNYKLNILVRVTNTPEVVLTLGSYSTVVLVGLPGTNPPMTLVSFDPVIGVFRPIQNPNEDPKVKLIAQFAVNEYISQTGNDVELLEVQRAQSRIVNYDVSGINYIFLISARTKGVDGIVHYEGNVFEGFPGTYPELELISFDPINLLSKKHTYFY